MTIVGIKFKGGGKVYYFAPAQDEEYAEGDEVIVETSKGLEYAYVAFPAREVEDSEVIQPLRPVIRLATDRDREQHRKNLERREEAVRIAQEKADLHKLGMKIIDAEFTFDGNKVLFYFSADTRVDFREMVRDLASTFRSRIELRQVGIRDETRILGGIAPCGRECCCAGAIQDFRKVTIKMAKIQGLSLNPGKISGLCGRLMCCLSYENDYYAEAYKKMPRQGSEVETPDGKGIVVSNDMLRYVVRAKIEKDGGLLYKDYPLRDVKFAGKDESFDAEEDEEPEEETLPAEEPGERLAPRPAGGYAYMSGTDENAEGRVRGAQEIGSGNAGARQAGKRGGNSGAQSGRKRERDGQDRRRGEGKPNAGGRKTEDGADRQDRSRRSEGQQRKKTADGTPDAGRESGQRPANTSGNTRTGQEQRQSGEGRKRSRPKRNGPRQPEGGISAGNGAADGKSAGDGKGGTGPNSVDGRTRRSRPQDARPEKGSGAAPDGNGGKPEGQAHGEAKPSGEEKAAGSV